ncbi:MAG: LytTR family DNA-binding domain-containing protein [Bacteroidota bacterium]
MINCLIVDDEKLARVILENYIQKLPNLSLVAQCKDSYEALAVVQSRPVDIVFLDIQMPELTGIELIRSLPQEPVVILSTAYPDYALEGFHLDVVDYLLKPYRFERFAQAVNKAIRRLSLTKKEPLKNTATSIIDNKNISLPKERDFVIVRADRKIHKINFDEILYIQGMKEYVNFQLLDGRILSLQSLKNLEETLPTEKFLRIHKSYIISLTKVTTLEGNAVYLGKDKLPIGGRYKRKVLDKLF